MESGKLEVRTRHDEHGILCYYLFASLSEKETHEMTQHFTDTLARLLPDTTTRVIVRDHAQLTEYEMGGM